MLNIAALRQQRIPLAVEPRAQVPFHILIPPWPGLQPHLSRLRLSADDAAGSGLRSFER
ncbi:hypothetical protein EDF75_0302 [Raoultella sp. BIGb0149]|nr:hypothetical protein EDF75_0302 [Raoultella sp. BIGb0149]